ncbi:MAG TPA: ABC transporter permease [Ktedonobacterales bacterium]|nr:ABC transporter permease [Ktedonobacterales bacterium]
MATTTSPELTKMAQPTAQPPVSSLTGGAPRPQHSRLGLTWIAFLAIFQRDVAVTLRDFIPFLLQVLIQPLFLLFIFGKILPQIGATQHGFAAILLPGVVALTIIITSLQSVTLPLVLDLGFAREIDDRLLAPLPVALVAVEKILFAALRGLIAGAVIFPLALWILGSDYNVRTDRLGMLILVMVLISLVGAALGMVIGVLVKPEQISLMFALIFTPLLFTGCSYYPWGSLGGIKWFQVLTLFNPLTYGSEGLRYAMTPDQHITVHSHGFTQTITVAIPTLATHWVYLGLVGTAVAFCVLGVWLFSRRVVS